MQLLYRKEKKLFRDPDQLSYFPLRKLDTGCMHSYLKLFPLFIFIFLCWTTCTFQTHSRKKNVVCKIKNQTSLLKCEKIRIAFFIFRQMWEGNYRQLQSLDNAVLEFKLYTFWNSSEFSLILKCMKFATIL